MRTGKLLRGCAIGLISLFVGGCGVTSTKPSSDWANFKKPKAAVSATHWFRDSAEYEAITRSVYRAARAQLKDIAFQDQCGTRNGERWAVVMDADETLLDNSAFQVESIRANAVWSAAAWNKWVARSEEGVVPGAKEFVAAVASKCGVIVVVTNRIDNTNTTLPVNECSITEQRLATLFAIDGKSPFAAVLCQTTDASGKAIRDKNPRFDRIPKELPGISPLRIEMFVGDSITDFPGFKKCDDTGMTIEAAGDLFGSKYFVLPNAMYGGWVDCPARPLSTLSRQP